MSTVLGFSIGCAGTAAVCWWNGRRRRGQPVATTAPPAALGDLPAAVGEELVHLANAVEGHALLVCESANDALRVTGRIEHLRTAVRRLRLLAAKLDIDRNLPNPGGTATDLASLLAGLRLMLEQHAVRPMQIEVTATDVLPPVAGDPDSLRQALLLGVHCLLARQPKADALDVRAAASNDDRGLLVDLTIAAHGDAASQPADALAKLNDKAAHQWLRALGGAFALAERGRHTVATLQLRPAVTTPAAVPEVRPTPDATPPHAFGGVLVLEPDASMREMLKTPLVESGRRVICCTDDAAAATLFEATPDRFELLILDTHPPRPAITELVATALSTNPSVRVLLLIRTSTPEADLPELGSRCQVLRRPFGIHQLRARCQTMLPPASIADAAS